MRRDWRLFPEGYRKMKSKAVSEVMLTLLLIGMLTVASDIQPAKASGIIYIKADGSIDPQTANITTVDNITYTFIDNINEPIVIARNNIVVDGAGYALHRQSPVGINLTRRSNVTIRNMEITAFPFGGRGIWIYGSSNISIWGNTMANGIDGIYMRYSNNNIISGNVLTGNAFGLTILYCLNNTVEGNDITSNDMGIFLGESSNNSIRGNNITNREEGVVLAASFNNSITENNIANNDLSGIRISLWSSDNKIYHNNFIDNTQQARIEGLGYANSWDDGYPSGGNYWSNHACTRNPSVGSQPYIIDEDNVDHYPFMDPNGWLLTLFGDLNKDRKVDIDDIMVAALSFGSYPEHPKWNPIADLTKDEIVDIDDIVTIAIHFGEHI